MPKLQTGGPLILTPENDKLDYLDKVIFLKQFIEGHYGKRGSFSDSEEDKMIALYGGRGSGKSSIMKTLSSLEYEKDKENEFCLNPNEFQTVFFEARKYEKDQNLVLSLFHFLGRELFKDDRNKELTIKDSIVAGLRGALGGLSFSLGGGIFPVGIHISGKDALDKEKEYLEEIKQKNEEDMIEKESFFNDHENLKIGFQTLSEKIETGKKLVVFIDDLDRCDSENVINLLSAIKLFFTYSQNIIFIVGIDKRAIVKGLQAKYNNDVEKADEYLEKLFTINFSMKKNLEIKELVLSSGLNKPACNILSELFQSIGFTNPRHIKKFLNKYNLLRNYIETDIPRLQKDKSTFIFFIYLAYLYEFKIGEFNNIYSKYPNRKRFVKIVIKKPIATIASMKTRTSDTYDIDVSVDSFKSYMRFFMKEFKEILYIKEGDAGHKSQNIINSEYLGTNTSFVRYISTGGLGVEAKDVIHIKAIIQNIR